MTDPPKPRQDTPPPPAGAELPGAALDQIAGGASNMPQFGNQSGPKPRPGH
ncbi:hypothetical protein [Teichococcus deserti]|uniref:hypothetical protein n=1 Tax=Teichococcus deserti TaxID=1817963 RepID=UPI0013F6799B|nr:hypothetical protein [Pseudoroseomonas deserti]